MPIRGEQLAVGAGVYGGRCAGGELPGVGPAPGSGSGGSPARTRQRRGEGVRSLGRDEDAAALAQGGRQAVDRGADDRDAVPQGQTALCDHDSSREGTTCTLAPAM